MGSEPHALGEAAVFRGLGRGQGLARLLVEGRGIAHRRVEPLGIEVVPQVVMGMDVALRAPAGIGPQQVPQTLDAADHRVAAGHALQALEIQRQHLKQR